MNTATDPTDPPPNGARSFDANWQHSRPRIVADSATVSDDTQPASDLEQLAAKALRRLNAAKAEQSGQFGSRMLPAGAARGASRNRG